MSYVFEKIELIENSLDLSRFKINDIDMWPHIRTNLIITLKSEMDCENINKCSYNKRVLAKLLLIVKTFKNLFGMIFFDWHNNDRSTSQRDIFFLTDTSSRRIRIGRNWYDVFIDPIIDYYETHFTHITYETSQRFVFRYPRYRTTKLITLHMLYYYLKSLCFIKIIKCNKSFTASFDNYISVMNKYGLQKHIIDLKDLLREASYIFQLSIFFKKKLEIIRPKIVFMIGYNGYSGRALCNTCRQLSIKSVDIQHGNQGNYHYAYSYFFNFPSSGFNVFPNYFLTWSYKESESINQWALKDNNMQAIAIGNLIEDKFNKSSQISKYFQSLFISKYHYLKFKHKILLTLQWSCTFPTIFTEILDRIPEKFFLLIRLHPSTTIDEKMEIKKILKKCSKNNYEFEYASILPIYTLLDNVVAHITASSSVVLEAYRQGVPSIITDYYGLDSFNEIIKLNKAFYCKNVTEIFERLELIIANEVIHEKISEQYSKDQVLDCLLFNGGSNHTDAYET